MILTLAQLMAPNTFESDTSTANPRRQPFTSGQPKAVATLASGDQRASIPADLSGTGLSIGLIRARWNDVIVDRLADGVHQALEDLKVTKIVEVSVPGCFEIPLAAKYLAESGQVDAVICIGAVIRGETTHYELVAGECGRGVQDVQLKSGIPVMFGVLTVENEQQAMARSEPNGGHNVGAEAATGAVEMARLAQKWVPFGASAS